MKRSPLLATLLLLSGALALFAEPPPPAPRDDAAAEKLGWHLATKAYTFRDRTLYETIDISRALGVKYFEMNPRQKLSPEHAVNTDETLPPELRAELKKKFADAGVLPVSFGVIALGKDEAKNRAIFLYAKEMGIRTLVSEPTEDTLEAIDKLCGEFEINVAIHNHPSPSHYASPETELKAFEGRSKRVGACADVGHWTRSGLNAVECLHQLEGHVLQLHFKDVGEGKKDVPWGTGGTDVKGMMAELHRQKFEGVFSMEYEGAAPAGLIDELKQSIVFFDREAGKLAEGK